MGEAVKQAVPALVEARKIETFIVRTRVTLTLGILARRFGYKDLKDFVKNCQAMVPLSSPRKVFSKPRKRSAFQRKAVVVMERTSVLRCMVSYLPIHEEMDALVACPYCKRIAKKKLLKEWLAKKGHCPVCRKPLQIKSCTKVILTH